MGTPHAIVSTYYFIRAGEVEDTFRIAEILVADGHELVQKATGSWLGSAKPASETRESSFVFWRNMQRRCRP